MKIEKAIQNDANTLTELTIRSKSHWNYSKEQIEEWKDDLTISETHIIEKEIYKMMDKEEVIGYYSFHKINDSTIKLENLFIEPKYIGKGFGKLLMIDFLQRIAMTTVERVVLDADTNAENFYTKMGFKVIEKLDTSIKNRFLPIMEMRIMKDPKIVKNNK